ncbi:NAD(P)/FAD-dependent oxidoreductase [Streptomyces orinoci]|uniref:FAD-dependent oxidoreductase n=1 Tax=Streptomyces orinoci TaxID=67339 RepID=A0ABV3K5C7_STRON|nr:FAD-dependent oxidoreductase [Streptomyces orinoci]
MSTRRVAVVGAGMAAARFAQQLLARTPAGAMRVTLYGAEAQAPYNRTLLTGVLTGDHDAEAIGLPYGDAQLRTGTEVIALDPGAGTLRLADGSTERYDTLVLATGAAPVRPPLDGTPPAAGVHTLRTLADCRRLAEDAARATRAVVIGGGVLGVSLAQALAAKGTHTQLVHGADWLMERHLDPDSARVLHHHLRGLGVLTRLGARPAALHGTGRVTAVQLADGQRLETDLVVLACGVRPRTGLARAAGLAVRHGIVVDDRLATSAPNVHAIGDCAEHRGTVHGLAMPAWEQADALAARLSGTGPPAGCTGAPGVLRLTTADLHLAAFGDPAADPAADHDVLHFADPTRGTCKRLVLGADRLRGGVLLGDVTAAADLIHLWRRQEPLSADPLHLLMPQGASA